MLKRCLSRKLSLLTAILLVTGLASQAQLNPAIGSSPWKWVNPAPIGFSLLDMSFIDNNTGLAVGVSGGIARTTDAGATWVSIPFKFVNPTSNTLAIASFNDVQFVTTGIAYAVGNTGLMIKSTDGGVNWNTVTTPLTALGKNINALHFLNKDTGYIGGQSILTGNTTDINTAPKIYYTKNGGASWDSLATPFVPQANAPTLNWNNEKEIHRIHFANDSVGYASGSSGNNFTGGQAALLWKIKKNVVTDYCVHRTKFGLTTTSHQPSVNTYKGLLAIDDTTVLMSTLNNNVVLRVRTGVNDSTANALPAVYGNYTKGKYEILIWLNSTTTPVPANLAGQVAGQMAQMKRTPDGKVVVVSGNSILFSADKGTTWTYTRPIPTTLNYAHWGFSALDVTANGRIIAGSFNGLIYDSLPGQPWKSIYKNFRPLFYSFTAMDWADNCNGIIVGSGGTIAKTSDGGKTWINNSNAVFDAAQIGLSNVVYHNVNSMFFSTGTTIYKSADQGTTNDAIFTEPNPNGSLTTFDMVGQDRAFVIGYRFSPTVQRTMIFRSLNANAASPAWDTVKTFPTGTLAPQLRNIKFANKDTGYTCGSRGKIYRTTDGGLSWTDISYDTATNGTINYTGLSVVDGKTLFVGGTSRKLLKSTDAGTTWTDITLSAATNPIIIAATTAVGNIVMNDVNNGYIQAGAALLKTSNGWSTWTADLAPAGISALSLYPKVSAPLANKKVYVMSLVAGFPGPTSTQTASLVEYGDATLYNLSTTEVVSATCTQGNTGSIVITAVGGLAPYTYSVNGSAFQTSNSFTGLSAGIKTIVIKDAGCQTVTKDVTVGSKPSPAVNAGPDKTIVIGDVVTLEGSSPNQVSAINWTPAATLSGANTFTPTATPSVSTTYTLTITDINNCVSTDNMNVEVIPMCLKIENAFTPNGDGVNDKWFVTQGVSCTKQIEVSVFNRYGSLVYKNDNYQNNWDGTYEGKPIPDATYYYRITFRLVNGQVRTAKGDVTIIR